MNGTLLKALVALAVVGLLFCRSAASFFRQKRGASLLQLLGAGCLIVVVFTHICEALRLFPWMHWGSKDSPGHYLDFWSAVLGFTLLATGYFVWGLDKAPYLPYLMANPDDRKQIPHWSKPETAIIHQLA